MVRRFVKLLHAKRVQAVEPWLEEAKKSASPELQVFALGLRREKDVFLSAVREPWSNGPVEGVVNKIKLAGRQVYGRATSRCCENVFYTPSLPIIEIDAEPTNRDHVRF